MSATGLPVFDETVQTTNAWLHEICSRLGWDERQKGYRLLRLCLHQIRDRLTVPGAAHFAAQMPMLMRGFYFEGWRPAVVPVGGGTTREFLAPISDGFRSDPDFDAAAAFREVVDVMRMHISEGEIEDVRRAMPAEIGKLWEPF